MKTLEYIVAGILFIVAVVFFDGMTRRVKTLEKQCDKVLELCADSSGLLLTEISAENDRIEALKAKCAACKPCACSPAKSYCCSCSPCACCKCGDCCKPKLPLPIPESKVTFDHFLWIQLHDGKVWFGWVDTDGVERETRLTLEEFERWSEED